MIAKSLSTPWSAGASAYSLPGSMMLKLRLGEAPANIPAQLDVRAKANPAASKIDGGVVDRLIRRHAGDARITRVHPAAASIGRWGGQHLGFSDQEQVIGLSRTFRVDVERGSPIGDLVSALNEVTTVEYAGPNLLSALPFESPEASQSAIDLGLAWASRDFVFGREAMAYEPGSPSVCVALVDSGVAARHIETNGRFRAGFDSVQLGTRDFAPGVSLLGDVTRADNNPIDNFVGHGMGCAGIIGAIGEQIPPGLAGECQMLPIRVLGAAKLSGKAQPVGLGSLSDIDLGVKMAVDLGAKVINMSFGTQDSALSPLAPKPHEDVVKYALMRGCILVAASGNSGKEELFWPAAHEGVIAVGSVGVEGKPSAFSTRGAHVSLCAVGERVATCSVQGYQIATGTSFAAPFVSAIAGLLVSRAQRRSFPIDGEVVVRVLRDSASPWGLSEVSGCGSGILNSVGALRALDRQIDLSPTNINDPDVPDFEYA